MKMIRLFVLGLLLAWQRAVGATLWVANIDPIYSRAPDVQWIGGMTVANTTRDMTSGTVYLVWTADATNGGFIASVRVKNDGTGNVTATVARIWINNGQTTSTAANNILFGELNIPAITASDAAATPEWEYPMNIALPAGYRVYITLGTDPGSTNLMATGVGGKY